MGEARADMVAQQLVARGIHATSVLDAMREIPRHRFMPQDAASISYRDHPVSIGEGQTISQPHVIAIMSSRFADLAKGAKILEIGSGSGYQTAILVHMGFEVHAVELLPNLAKRAEPLLEELGLSPASMTVGDGHLGLPEQAPFDGIIAAACAKRLPKQWAKQLAPGGIIVAPIQHWFKQTMYEWRKPEASETGGKVSATTGLQKNNLGEVRFVPLVKE